VGGRYFKRIFALFDDDDSEQIDFKEYVCGLWNYASLSRASLIHFTFDLYDDNDSGRLDPAEIKQVVTMVMMMM
jgi:Ca2+-binding EF-hand superfamily protein